MLLIEDVAASYGFLQVLWGVSIRVDEGEFVGLIGPNGAGKTTTLKTIAGFLKPQFGRVLYRGQVISSSPPYRVSRLGIAYVSEALNLFPAMPIEENLLLGAHILKDRRRERELLEYVYDLFPRLQERRRQLAGTLSGGERKMLAIARGLMSDPQLILIDEPSLGLAPGVALAVFEALATLHERGTTILLVEQNAAATLEITDRAYVLEQGRVALEGTSATLLTDTHVRDSYLGVH